MRKKSRCVVFVALSDSSAWKSAVACPLDSQLLTAVFAVSSGYMQGRP